jgi:hypothetical protein
MQGSPHNQANRIAHGSPLPPGCRAGHAGVGITQQPPPQRPQTQQAPAAGGAPQPALLTPQAAAGRGSSGAAAAASAADVVAQKDTCGSFKQGIKQLFSFKRG